MTFRVCNSVRFVRAAASYVSAILRASLLFEVPVEMHILNFANVRPRFDRVRSIFQTEVVSVSSHA